MASIILSIRVQKALYDVASNIRQALHQVVYGAQGVKCEDLELETMSGVKAWIESAWKATPATPFTASNTAGAYTRPLLSST